MSIRFGAALLMASVTVSVLGAQAPPPGPTFEVVSIKRNQATGRGGLPVTAPPIERPDGGFTLTAVPIMVLVARAYPPVIPLEIVGLPEWSRTERYDVSATSTLSRRATPEERAAMLRAMLADRVKLLAHFEKRELSLTALVRARKDGSLGPGLTRIDTDCDAKRAADRAEVEAATAAGHPPPPPARPLPGADFQPPPCNLWSVADRDGLTRVRGEGTMNDLAQMLRFPMRATIVDRTGLAGSYRLEMSFQSSPLSATAPDPSLVIGPDIATALSQRLGLKLENQRLERDVLVVDRVERPSEN